MVMKVGRLKIKWYWQALVLILIVLGIVVLIASKLGMLGFTGFFALAPIPSIVLWVAALVCYIAARKRAREYKLS